MDLTAKEKADELYTIFSNAANSYLEGKKCALIAVDEILKAYPTTVETWHNAKGLNLAHLDNRKWWKLVKQEIEKL